MEKRTNTKQLKVGDRLSRISYVQITGIRADGRLDLRNSEGLEWIITPDIVAHEMYSASQFTDTKKVSRTEMVEAMESAGDAIFTVVFDKKVSQKDVVETLQTLDTVPEKKTALNKLAKGMLSGSERTLVGFLASTEPKMGRSTCVDLEIGTGYNLRLVDHRTVKELILRNVRYVLK